MKKSKVHLVIVDYQGVEWVNAEVTKSQAVKIAKQYEKFVDINSKQIIEQLEVAA